MKAKNQLPISSESDAKEKLIVYVYEYLCHSGAKRAAQTFLDEISYEKEIQFNQHEPPGFLANWWCVFWDLYCAAPEKRNQPEPSTEAKVFHEYNMRTVMSPSCTQTSPHQQGPPFMGGAGGPGGGGGRYGPHSGQLRGSPINMGHRMQAMNQGPPPPPQMGGLPPNGPPPPHPPMMGAASPRYAPHPGHMTPGSSTSSVGLEPGPSPGMNRMTPASLAGSPHPQVGPPNGMGGPMSGPPPHGAGPPPPHGGPLPQGVAPMQQRGLPPQGWQGNFGSPAEPQQQCFMNGPPVGGPPQQQGEFGGMTMMSDGSGMMDSKSVINNGGAPAAQQQQQDEYILPNPYGPPVDQVGEPGSEIMKLKESLENNTKEYSDGGDQPGYNMDFPPDQQNKWN